MGTYQNFVEKVRYELSAQGVSVRDIAARSGVPVRSLHGILGEGHVPSIERAAEIISALGLEVYIGPPREDSVSSRSPVERLEVTLREAIKALDEMKKEAALAPSDTEAAVKMRHVEVVELEAAAGDGAASEWERVKGRVAFRADWLKRHRLDPEQCRIMGVMGESMEPTLPDGCSILVDMTRKRLRSGRIFLVRGEDGITVKRAVREGRKWILESEHPAWEPIPWPNSAEVVGEVRWMARTL